MKHIRAFKSIVILSILLSSAISGYGQYWRLGSWNTQNASEKRIKLLVTHYRELLNNNKVDLVFTQELQTSWEEKNIDVMLLSRKIGQLSILGSPQYCTCNNKNPNDFYARSGGNSEQYGVMHTEKVGTYFSEQKRPKISDLTEKFYKKFDSIIAKADRGTIHDYLIPRRGSNEIVFEKKILTSGSDTRKYMRFEDCSFYRPPGLFKVSLNYKEPTQLEFYVFNYHAQASGNLCIPYEYRSLEMLVKVFNSIYSNQKLFIVGDFNLMIDNVKLKNYYIGNNRPSNNKFPDRSDFRFLKGFKNFNDDFFCTAANKSYDAILSNKRLENHVSNFQIKCNYTPSSSLIRPNGSGNESKKIQSIKNTSNCNYQNYSNIQNIQSIKTIRVKEGSKWKNISISDHCLLYVDISIPKIYSSIFSDRYGTTTIKRSVPIRKGTSSEVNTTKSFELPKVYQKENRIFFSGQYFVKNSQKKWKLLFSHTPYHDGKILEGKVFKEMEIVSKGGDMASQFVGKGKEFIRKGQDFTKVFTSIDINANGLHDTGWEPTDTFYIANSKKSHPDIYPLPLNELTKLVGVLVGVGIVIYAAKDFLALLMTAKGMTVLAEQLAALGFSLFSISNINTGESMIELTNLGKELVSEESIPADSRITLVKEGKKTIYKIPSDKLKDFSKLKGFDADHTVFMTIVDGKYQLMAKDSSVIKRLESNFSNRFNLYNKTLPLGKTFMPGDTLRSRGRNYELRYNFPNHKDGSLTIYKLDSLTYPVPIWSLAGVSKSDSLRITKDGKRAEIYSQGEVVWYRDFKAPNNRMNIVYHELEFRNESIIYWLSNNYNNALKHLRNHNELTQGEQMVEGDYLISNTGKSIFLIENGYLVRYSLNHKRIGTLVYSSQFDTKNPQNKEKKGHVLILTKKSILKFVSEMSRGSVQIWPKEVTTVAGKLTLHDDYLKDDSGNLKMCQKNVPTDKVRERDFSDLLKK